VVERSPDEVDDRGLGPGGLGGRVAADGCADDGEDAGADDDAYAESGERDGAEGLFEGVLGTLGVGDKFVDGLGGEDLAGQGKVSVALDLLDCDDCKPTAVYFVRIQV
jgi:hypothetical protein